MSLLNKSQVRQFALDHAAKTRAQFAGRPWFNRVSSEFYEQLEADLRVMIQNRIHRTPSKGRTL